MVEQEEFAEGRQEEEDEEGSAVGRLEQELVGMQDVEEFQEVVEEQQGTRMDQLVETPSGRVGEQEVVGMVGEDQGRHEAVPLGV